MDKSVKIILGLAIAILFPIFVWFAVYTFIPDPKASRPEYPKSPEVPNCRNYSSDYSDRYSQSDRASLNDYKDCQYQNDRYDQALKSHDAEVKEYEQEMKDLSRQKQQIVVWRAQFALVLAIFGMLAVLASTSVVGVATGLAGGAAATIVIAVSFLIPSLIDDTKTYTELSIILLLVGFCLLTAELWYVDNFLYPDEGSGLNDLNGPSFSQDESTIKSNVVNTNLNDLKESVMKQPIEVKPTDTSSKPIEELKPRSPSVGDTPIDHGVG